MNQFEQLRTMTTIVADTGDIDEIARVKPADATTNPSLILVSATNPKYARFIEQARQYDESPDLRIDRVLTGFGCAILDVLPGRISTELDVRLSFDSQATVEKARRIIALYEAMGVSRERVLLKIAGTWEGIAAARVLELEGIHCNITLIFDLVQAEASAQARATIISPYAGRIYDWYKRTARQSWDEAANSGVNDPGVRSVTAIYRRLKLAGSNTQVMGASFRNVGEILALAGCDFLTVAPKYIDELAAVKAPVERVLTPEGFGTGEPILVSEAAFRFAINENAMATENLSTGIRNFARDTRKLEALLA